MEPVFKILMESKSLALADAPVQMRTAISLATNKQWVNAEFVGGPSAIPGLLLWLESVCVDDHPVWKLPHEYWLAFFDHCSRLEVVYCFWFVFHCCESVLTKQCISEQLFFHFVQSRSFSLFWLGSNGGALMQPTFPHHRAAKVLLRYLPQDCCLLWCGWLEIEPPILFHLDWLRSEVDFEKVKTKLRNHMMGKTSLKFERKSMLAQHMNAQQYAKYLNHESESLEKAFNRQRRMAGFLFEAFTSYDFSAQCDVVVQAWKRLTLTGKRWCWRLNPSAHGPLKANFEDTIELEEDYEFFAKWRDGFTSFRCTPLQPSDSSPMKEDVEFLCDSWWWHFHEKVLSVQIDVISHLSREQTQLWWLATPQSDTPWSAFEHPCLWTDKRWNDFDAWRLILHFSREAVHVIWNKLAPLQQKMFLLQLGSTKLLKFAEICGREQLLRLSPGLYKLTDVSDKEIQ